MSEPISKPATLAERAARTQEVVDAFRDKPFSWKGRANCIHLARAQLVAFGYRPSPVPQFATALGARRALEKRGVSTLGALLDSMLPRITPAGLWVGDIAMLPGEAGFEALTIAVGGGYVLGWHGEDLSRLLPIHVSGADIVAAWRV